jgi:hypothetical protein
MEIAIDSGALAELMLRAMLGVRSESGRIRTVRVARTAQSPRGLADRFRRFPMQKKTDQLPYE